MRRAFGQDLALMDDERAVDELERFAHVVIRNKHPDSPSGKLSHQLRISPIAIGSIPAKARRGA